MSPLDDYPLLRAHDPNGTRLRTLLVTLDEGDALLSTTTLVPVDEADAPIVGGDFAVEFVSLGFVNTTADGDVWGYNFKLHNGVDLVGTTARIRLRPYLASQPSEPAYDQTYRVPVKHT
jgi:hypothetical protein